MTEGRAQEGAGATEEAVAQPGGSAKGHRGSSHGAHRAKAFLLDTDTNDWDELATGACTPDPSEDGAVFTVRLCSEEDPTLVLFTATFHKDHQISIQNGRRWGARADSRGV